MRGQGHGFDSSTPLCTTAVDHDVQSFGDVLRDGKYEMTDNPVARPSAPVRRMLLPLALAQFICSFAGSNMNVMINDISVDLDTTVQGVQTAITVFLLVMAAFMIPGGKLTDRWGRKRCFVAGLVLYGVGAS